MDKNNTKYKNITRKQAAVIALLATHDVAHAAEQAHVNRATIYRWLREPDFKAALQASMADILDTVSRRLVSLAVAATDVLADVMANQANPATVKLRAADIVLNRLLQVRELIDLEQRVTDLEEQAKGK